jgi:hypothetical protein
MGAHHAYTKTKTMFEMSEDLARCDREIAEASQRMEAPAWLVTLWAEDWKRERLLIERASQVRTDAPLLEVPVSPYR